MVLPSSGLSAVGAAEPAAGEAAGADEGAAEADGWAATGAATLSLLAAAPPHEAAARPQRARAEAARTRMRSNLRDPADLPDVFADFLALEEGRQLPRVLGVQAEDHARTAPRVVEGVGHVAGHRLGPRVAAPTPGAPVRPGPLEFGRGALGA
ncbi:hypothetical protein GCM10020219_009770 [Nonomuraea dietziae]